MSKPVKDMGASVRAKLLTYAKAHETPFDMVLNRYVIERLLYRLSLSGEADRYVLKGATLLMTWLDEPHRGTRDLDLLGFGDASPESLLSSFRAIMMQAIGGRGGGDDDGLTFDADGLRVDRIRENAAYGGVRLRTTATLAGAKIPISIDVGFGDSIAPGTELIEFPVLLDLPKAKLRAYARETVVAEKFEAMVSLGSANTRLKDYYDIWVLARAYEFDPARLAAAIAATFARRNTDIPTERPDALSAAFANDPDRRAQWSAFLDGTSLDPGQLTTVIEELAAFLMPLAERARAL